jgi:hypothetical protein
MFVLGLLVLAAATVAGVELVLANRGPMDFHMWNWTWHFDAFWLAVIGAAIVTAAWLALGLMQMSFAHARRVRRQNRELARENRMLAERVNNGDTIEPMPAERPVAERRVVERPVGTTAADGGYDAAAGQHAVEQDGYTDADGDGVPDQAEQHHGFFSRHATSGRNSRA